MRSLYHSLTSDVFRQIQHELGALLAALETAEGNSANLPVTANESPELREWSQECHQVLSDLQELNARFSRVNTKAHASLEKMDFVAQGLVDIQSRLSACVASLNLSAAKTIKYSALKVALTQAIS